VYTMGYCHTILDDHDDSSILTMCHQGTLTLLEKDEAEGLSLLWLNLVTAHCRMCHPILDGYDGMAVASPSSSHNDEEHQHRSGKER